MKRSEQIVLTTLFLTAVSSYATRAQDVMVSANERDSSRAQHTTTSTSHGHFHSFFHHHHTQSSQQAVTTSTPRKTGGFGMSLRTTSSAHS